MNVINITNNNIYCCSIKLMMPNIETILTRTTNVNHVKYVSITKKTQPKTQPNTNIDAILAQININQINEIDKIAIETAYMQKYEKKLRCYEFVEQSKLFQLVNTGDIIRYSKSLDHLSCGSIVLQINRAKQKVKSLLLGTPKYIDANVWKIYPENYYIFVKTCSTSKIAELVREKKIFAEYNK